MAEETKNALVDAAERAGIPVVTIGFVIAFAVTVRESADKLGWRVIAILVSAVCVAWAFYVRLATRPNALDPTHNVRRFGPAARFGAAAAAIASLLPLLYMAVIRFPSPRVPFFTVKVINRTATPLEVSEYAEFFLTEVESPLSDRLVRSGRLRFQSGDRPASFVVQPKASAWFIGRFQNEDPLVPLLARGDLKLAVVVTTEGGRSVTLSNIAFVDDSFGKHLIEIPIE